MDEISYTDRIRAELQKIDTYNTNIDDESLSMLQKAEIDLSLDIPSPPPSIISRRKSHDQQR